MKQRGFTVIEVLIVLVVVFLVGTVGTLVYRRVSGSGKQDLTSPQAIQQMNEEDSIGQQTPFEYTSATPEQVAAQADASPVLRKVTEPNDQCEEGFYQVISDSGEVIGCLVGGE